MNTKIPKRVIQIWGGGADLSLLSRAAAVNLRLLNPGFEYVLFDDKAMEDFIREHSPEHLDVFYSFPVPVQRYDFFRYLAIYHHGGFYFDLDVFLATGIQDLLDSGCVFAFEALTINGFLRENYGMDWELGNYAFGAVPRHPFLQAIIENCIRAQKDSHWVEAMMQPIPRIFRDEFRVLYTTGPGLVSRTFAEYVNATDVRVLFPEDVCDISCWDRFGEYGVHLRQGSWRKRKGLLRRRLIALWMSLEESKRLKESRRLGGRRSLQLRHDP